MSVQVELSGLSGVGYDRFRDQFYLSTTGGDLYAFSSGAGGLTKKLHLGGPLSDIDISADGTTLIVGERDFLGSSSGNLDAVYRVSLSDLSVQRQTFLLSDIGQGGVYDVASIDAQTAFLTMRQAGSQSGYLPMREFAYGTSTATQVVPPGGNLGGVSAESYLVTSETHRYILLQEANTSSGPLSLYDTQAHRFIANTDLYRLGYSGWSDAPAAISESAGLIVDVVSGNALVLDLELKLVKTLATLTSTSSVIGAAFNAGGHQLFLWNSAAGAITVFDTLSWKQVGSLAPMTVLDPSNFSRKGTMLVDARGHTLIVDTQTGFEAFDLTSELKLTVTGGGPARSHFSAPLEPTRLPVKGARTRCSALKARTFCEAARATTCWTVARASILRAMPRRTVLSPLAWRWQPPNWCPPARGPTAWWPLRDSWGPGLATPCLVALGTTGLTAGAAAMCWTAAQGETWPPMRRPPAG